MSRFVVAVASVLAISGCAADGVMVSDNLAGGIEPAAGHNIAMDWPDTGDCRTLVSQIDAMNDRGLLSTVSGTAPIALLVDDADLSLIGDMPLPVTSQNAVGGL